MDNIIAKEAAKDLTQQIREATERLWELIVMAYQWRAWQALGYPSWDAYIEGEFGTLRVRLPREERQEVMRSLRDHGLSLRAIASATGYDKRTVSRDLDALAETKPETMDVIPPIKGMNGKTYKPRRELPDSFWTVSYDLAKLGDRIAKLAEHQQFGDSREKIKEANLRYLQQARDALDSVIAKLEGALV